MSLVPLPTGILPLPPALASAAAVGGAGGGSAAAVPAAAVPAAAAAPAAAPNPYDAIWSTPGMLSSMFNLLTQLTKHIYSLHPKNMHFYMKGGNAFTLLKRMYKIDDTAFFPSDFDFTLLINPHLTIDEYNALQASALNVCLQIIIGFCGGFETGASTNPIHFHEVELFGGVIKQHPNEQLNQVFAYYRDKSLHSLSPFELIIRPNTSYQDKIFDIGVILLRLRQAGGRNIDLFDISFNIWNPTNPSSTAMISAKRDWSMTHLEHYQDVPFGLDVMLYDPFTAFVNMHIAARRNTRENKRAKRLARAKNLQNAFKFNANTYKNRRNTTRKFLANEANLKNII
jgi:hypothetical protein